jgi:hypothetical protein
MVEVILEGAFHQQPSSKSQKPNSPRKPQLCWEPVYFATLSPQYGQVSGPLTSSNKALPLPCRMRSLCLGSQPAQQCRHVRNWRQSYLEQMVYFPLERWWPQCHSQCVSFSGAKQKVFHCYKPVRNTLKAEESCMGNSSLFYLCT